MSSQVLNDALISLKHLIFVERMHGWACVIPDFTCDTSICLVCAVDSLPMTMGFIRRAEKY